MAGSVRANYTGNLTQPDGTSVYVLDGDEFPADHPLVTTHPDYFEDSAGYEAHERVDVTTYADLPGRRTIKGRKVSSTDAATS